MPGEVDGSVVEILGNPEPRGHVLGQIVEVLWGPAGTIRTQEAQKHAQVVEVLTNPETRGHNLGEAVEVLWQDLTFQLEMDAEAVEVLWSVPSTVRTEETQQYGSVVEVLTSAADRADMLGSGIAMLVTYDAAVAAVADISGPSATPATFVSTSLGLISQSRWNWVSVPGGSALVNSTQPLPNGGGAGGIIDMTSNAVLYHAEEPSGGTGTDTSGSGNDAALTAITVGAVGQVGSRAWSYTGTTSKAQPATPVPIPGDWTVAFWFYNLAPNTSFRTGVRGNVSDHQIMVENGGDRLGVYMGGFQPSGATMPSASFTGWHHMIAVGTGGDTAFYVDGVFAGKVFGFQSTDAINCIGNYQGNGQRFADRIDEFALWNRALKRAEVVDLFWLQEGNYAGAGSSFLFVPDVDGIYTVNLTVESGLDLSLDTDTAIATIGASSSLLMFPLQGDQIRMWGHLQGAPLRKRGQK